jgi:hypothetical protein
MALDSLERVHAASEPRPASFNELRLFAKPRGESRFEVPGLS